MGRIITPEKIEAMRAAIEADPSAVGPNLGVALIKGNVPIEGAAEIPPIEQKIETLHEIRDAMRDRYSPLDPPALRMHTAQVNTVFRIWIVVFALVGSQMGWVLRPFIGSPYLPFEWFRPRSSNFFEAVWHLLRGFFGG